MRENHTKHSSGANIATVVAPQYRTCYIPHVHERSEGSMLEVLRQRN
jgi:hypothetical protein